MNVCCLPLPNNLEDLCIEPKKSSVETLGKPDLNSPYLVSDTCYAPDLSPYGGVYQNIPRPFDVVNF